MTASPSTFNLSLPLNVHGRLERPEDWMGLWEELVEMGPAVFLESAGPLYEASRWLILAGDPECEFFSQDGISWIGNGSGVRPADFDVWEFLGEAGRITPTVSPAPFCFSQAWFGIFSYEFSDFMKSENVILTFCFNMKNYLNDFIF